MMKKEIKLKLDFQMMEVLSDLFRHLSEFESPIKRSELEYYVVMEFYESKFKAFNILKKKTITFKPSQAISLGRILKNIETSDGFTRAFINDLLGQFHKHFPELI